MSLFEKTNTAGGAALQLLDGGRAAAAAAVARGTARLLRSLGFCAVGELPLASGRRADLVGLGTDGEIVVVEIKSSVADFRADRKWLAYRRHCDRLFFATTLGVPPEIAGLIVADGFGAATRRSMTLRFARAAALRLQVLGDPGGAAAVDF